MLTGNNQEEVSFQSNAALFNICQKSALFAKSSVILRHFYVILRHFWVKLSKKCPFFENSRRCPEILNYTMVKYLLLDIDVFTKYAWVKPLKGQKAKTVFHGFIEIVNESKPNELWVDRENESYNSLM